MYQGGLQRGSQMLGQAEKASQRRQHTRPLKHSDTTIHLVQGI